MARLQQEKQAAVTTGSARSTGIPCAMVLTVSFVLSSVTGLSCHRRWRKISSANLASASGCQDHTTSPSASSAFRLVASRRPLRPAPNVRDDREAPLISRRDDGNMDLIWVRRETEYFFGKDWTGGIALSRFMKFGFARKCAACATDFVLIVIPCESGLVRRSLSVQS